MVASQAEHKPELKAEHNFQLQTFITGLILILYGQTSDILLVSSMGTVAAKWQKKFQDSFANKEGSNQNFPKQNNHFSTMCEGWLQCVASMMHGLPTLQNHLLPNCTCILPESEKLKLDHFKSTQIKWFNRIWLSESNV